MSEFRSSPANKLGVCNGASEPGCKVGSMAGSGAWNVSKCAQQPAAAAGARRTPSRSRTPLSSCVLLQVHSVRHTTRAVAARMRPTLCSSRIAAPGQPRCRQICSRIDWTSRHAILHNSAPDPAPAELTPGPGQVMAPPREGGRQLISAHSIHGVCPSWVHGRAEAVLHRGVLRRASDAWPEQSRCRERERAALLRGRCARCCR